MAFVHTKTCQNPNCGRQFFEKKGFIKYCSIKCRAGSWRLKMTEEDLKVRKSGMKRAWEDGKYKDRVITHSAEDREAMRKKIELYYQITPGARQALANAKLGCTRPEGVKRKISATMKELVPFYFIRKSGKYRGIVCKNAWELAWVIYQVNNGVQVERNRKYFEYYYEGRRMRYKPAYRLGSGNSYVDIKCMVNKWYKRKVEYFPYGINIIRERGMLRYLDYAITTYGFDIFQLYDSNTGWVPPIINKVRKVTKKQLRAIELEKRNRTRFDDNILNG
jgi:hypothetical protein